MAVQINHQGRKKCKQKQLSPKGALPYTKGQDQRKNAAEKGITQHPERPVIHGVSQENRLKQRFFYQGSPAWKFPIIRSQPFIPHKLCRLLAEKKISTKQQKRHGRRYQNRNHQPHISAHDLPAPGGKPVFVNLFRHQHSTEHKKQAERHSAIGKYRKWAHTHHHVNPVIPKASKCAQPVGNQHSQAGQSL